LFFFSTAGRGVLIDYASWAEKRDIKYTTFSLHEIKLSDILEIAKECNITFQRGDILIIRIGVTKEWDSIMTDAQKQAYSQNPNPHHAGVEGTIDVIRWLWDTGFAAVAGDAISWEVRFWIQPNEYPMVRVTFIGFWQVYPPTNPEVFLHEYLLAGWGMPVGELNSQNGL
jgi:hypothetical protein